MRASLPLPAALHALLPAGGQRVPGRAGCATAVELGRAQDLHLHLSAVMNLPVWPVPKDREE